MSLQISQAQEVLSGLMKEKGLIMQKLEPRKAPPKLKKKRTVRAPAEPPKEETMETRPEQPLSAR